MPAHVSFLLAGDGAATRHTLLDDFLRVARKLEELGFTYYEGKVLVTNSLVNGR